jgi:bifunctional non-homologous end joining protein LigD
MPRKRGRGSAFTVDVPEPLPAERDGEHWWLEVDGHRLRLTNLDKVFWPKEGYTKGDLLAYYWNVRDLILPYLRDRPLTRKRMPDGVEGPYFYEKNAPAHTPAWMPRCRVKSEDDEARMGFNDFLVANEPADLLFVVSTGAIEFHPLHARCDSIDHPDYLFFDLDPMGEASFEDVLAVARHVHVALEHLGLPAYAKTSGATGVQIYVGVDPRPTHDELRAFVGSIGQAVRGVDPDRVTMEYQVRKRGDKVFIDHNMNRRGANISAVYCVRPEPGATVSTPLSWDEVEAGEVRPQDFTIANAHERFAEVGDLFEAMLTDPVDPSEAFAALGIELTDPRPWSTSPPLQRTSGGTYGGKAGPAGRAAHASAGAGGGGGTTVRSAGPTRQGKTDARRTGASEEPPAPPNDAKLAEYERKRKFDVTPEPPPAVKPGNDELFVIQKHDATRLHYDLRLERDGVLVSWAVPRGLPLVPGEKRLAVHTEDHPIEYGDFEGWIPEGEYGAGEVRIFDRGRYEAPEWKDDKVTFRLEGSRHRGEYHLVKTKTDWLVFLSKSSAELQPPQPPSMLPMLAEGGYEPFDHPDWRFEPKLDGIRTLAYVGTDGTQLVSRTGRDQTERYPELESLARFVNALQAVIDGEIVAAGPDGRPSFEMLQQRMNLHAAKDIEKARRKIPVVMFAFDLLWLDGKDLTHQPLERRRELLDEVVTETGPMRLTVIAEEDGEGFFELAQQLGFEGVVAKRRGSLYIPGRRTKDWRKIKATNYQDCLILGWTQGTGSREATFGALLLGAYRDGELIWIGQVGTGFNDTMLRDLLGRLRELEISEPSIADPELARIRGARWTRPELVCEVEFLEMTRVGKLRAPAFKGLRPDKAPADAILERPATQAE